MAEKPHMNLAVIGHIDHGKSTLVGRLMYDTGAVEAHVIEKYKEEAKAKGKESFAFAWVMDSLKEERERGITIDIAHQRFDTDKYYFTVVDCPGHRDFVKNMITGASQADAAILVVSGKDSVQAQTKEHVFLSRTLGINQLIIAINKMDEVNYDEAKYNKAKEDVSALLKIVGFKPADQLLRAITLPARARIQNGILARQSWKPLMSSRNLKSLPNCLCVFLYRTHIPSAV